jgi:hypothetical protein
VVVVHQRVDATNRWQKLLGKMYHFETFFRVGVQNINETS